MKINYKVLIICIAIPLIVGFLSGFITSDSVQSFNSLNKPTLTPPASVFPVAWSILYVLMGLSSYVIFMANANEDKKKEALKIYGVQLFFNFCWSIIFFSFELYFIAFLWLLALIALVVLLMIKAKSIDIKATYLLVLYLAWICFAGYLNFAIFILN